MPQWVQQSFGDYSVRMPRDCKIILHEIATSKRNKTSNIPNLVAKEWQAMHNKIPKNAIIIALDVVGDNWSTQQLCDKLRNFKQQGSDLALLIGGPDGLDATALALADYKWSLSNLTLPHAMVRVIVAEALYRAHSFLIQHPYHRA